MRILEEFWYGNIEPTEYDTSSCKEYKKLLELICRNEEKLQATIGKLTAEYGRIGNNLNQIARHLNEWHSPYPVMAKELQDAAADLATLKFEVMKKVGDAVGNVQAYQL